jgi:hypothetical protein
MSGRVRGAPAGVAGLAGRRLAVLVVAAVVLVAGAVGVVAAVRGERRVGAGERVVLYGDSLSVEAGPAFVAAVRAGSDAEVEVRATPGTAPCDALASIRADLAGAGAGAAPGPPSVAVLQFTGNNATPCVAGPGGSPLTGAALAERYAADVGTAAEELAAAGVRVVIAGPPPAPGLPGRATELIDEGYLSLVTRWAGIDIGRVRYAPAGEAVAGDDRAYVQRLPCRSGSGEGEAEGCEGGEIVVRSPDRIHFCPTALTDELTCPVHSSGAERFGDEMARVAIQALDPTY